MIAISEDFKNAIKDRNRQIKGYAEVTYLSGNINGSVTSDGIGTDVANIVDNTDEILTGNKVVTNYASLEQNYFKLDGSFILPNDPAGFYNDNTGYISDDIESNYNTKKIKISSNTSDVIIYDDLYGLTIYFKDNIPATINFKIGYINHMPITKTINNNIDDVVYFEFDKISYVTYIEITLNDFMYNNRRIRIPKIEAGISNVYKDNDLIEFKVTEQISEFNVEMPIDECDVTIGNYDNKFDIMNPQGLIKYLNDNVQVKPFIGVVTENNGIEYVPMGVYYLQSYTNNNDKTTTFHCEKNFRKLASSNSYFRARNTSAFNATASNFFSKICQEFGVNNYSFNATTDNNVVNDDNVPLCNKLSHLNMFSIFSNIIIRNGREDNVIAENIGNDIEDILTLNEMKNIPTYNKKDILQTIIINKTDLVLGNFKEEYETIFEGDIQVSEDNPFIIILDKSRPVHLAFTPSVNPSVYYDYEIHNGWYFVSTGKLNGNYHLKVETMVDYNEQKIPVEYKLNNSGSEIQIDNGFYNPLIENASLLLDTAIQNTVNYIKNNYKKYNIKIDYFGNPAYEVNDVLQIETPYGYKTMRILKHSLTFNGALSGSIEGVGD